MVAIIEMLVEISMGLLIFVSGALIGLLVLFIWIKRDDPELFEALDRWLKQTNKE